MTELLRRRTISAFLACSGLISYVISPAYSQVSPPHSSSSISTGTGSTSSNSPAPATNYSGTNVIDFGKNGGTLVLKGDLINSGTLYAISTNPAISTAIFSAANVYNHTGAIISTVVPSGGLPGYANAISGLNLVFNVTNNFVNAGTISSAGSLAINAGGTITNALPTGVTAPLPVMQAVNSIDISSQIGSIVNAGTIASITGNINLTAAAANALAVNNVGGIMQALQGNINVRDSLFSGTSALNIVGGDWLSKNLNLMNGNGAITAYLGSATGVINALGSAAQIGVDKGDLILGSLNVNGDPTYYNAGGGVALPATINTAGADLAVVASGDITAAVGSTVAITTGGAASSGNVIMVAGAKFINPTSGSGNNDSSTTVTWASPTSSDSGGSISIPTLTIDTSGNNNHGAGNVTLVAYQGTANASGQILTQMSSSFIKASNSPGFSGGNVTLIAGATSGNPIVFGNITGGGGSAAIGVYAATPVISGSGTISVKDGTQIAGGTYSPGQLHNARIDLGVLNNDGAAGLGSTVFTPATDGANGGAITVKSAGNVNLDSIFSRGGQGGSDGAGQGSVGAGGAGGTLTLQGADIFITNDTQLNGGAGGTPLSLVLGVAGGLGGSGGQLLSSSTNFQSNGNISAKGADGSGGGGAIIFSGGDGAAGGTGGLVQITARQQVTTAAIDTSGGAGGSGGFSGVLGGSHGGAGAGGGAAGRIVISAGTALNAGNYVSKGAQGGNGGNAFSGQPGNAGNGGKGGTITLSSVACCLGDLDVSGGAGGSAGADLGPTGLSANGGNGGSGGTVTVSSSGGLDVFGAVKADAGLGGAATNGGTVGSGGSGGTITLTQTVPNPSAPGVVGALVSGEISAKGFGAGSKGGTITLNSNVGFEVDGVIYVPGSKGAAAGKVSITTPNITLNGTNVATGASIDASSDQAAGGAVTINLNGGPCSCNIISGGINVDAAGAGNKGGTISVNAPSALVEIDGSLNARGTNGAAGGSIQINSDAFAIAVRINPTTQTAIDVSSTQASAGTVSITGSDIILPSIVAGPINANGSGAGNKAGTVNLNTQGAFFEIDGPVNAIGRNGSDGGLISISAVQVSLTNPDAFTGNSLDVSSVRASAGSITLLTTGPAPLSNAGCACSGLSGNIAASGQINGGRINLASSGGFVFNAPLSINANGFAGQGGLIQFTSPGSSTLHMKNDGIISAINFANNSGRIGFNVGDTGAVNISGTGSMTAGDYVGIGALDPLTLAIQNPRQVQLSDFPFGNYSFVQNNVSNRIFVSQPLPPTPGTSTKTLTGGVSVQAVLPSSLPNDSESSTIIKTDQIQFVVSVTDNRLIGGRGASNSFIDGVRVISPGDALKANGILVAQNGDGNLVLSRGNLLVLPVAGFDGGMEIITKEGTLFVAPGSIAFLIETGNDVAVYALHEGQAGDITFKSGKQTIELYTGQQAVFTRSHHSQFSSVNPSGLIPARKVNSYKMDNGVTAFIAEYSMPAALSVIQPLKDLRNSEDSRLCKASSTIQKNAAIISLIGSKYGPYKHNCAP